MQLTLDNLPDELADALQAKAQAEGKTLHQVALEALAAAAGKKRDLSDISGTWLEDPEFDQVMRDQDRIELEMWK